MILVYHTQTGFVEYGCSEPEDLSDLEHILEPNQAYHVVPNGTDISQLVANADGVVEVGDYPEFATSYNFVSNAWIVDTDRETQAQWDDLRSKRATLLNKSDWTQVPDSPLSDEQKAAWATYRQALRDLPSQTNDPQNAVWPTPPNM